MMERPASQSRETIHRPREPPYNQGRVSWRARYWSSVIHPDMTTETELSSDVSGIIGRRYRPAIRAIPASIPDGSGEKCQRSAEGENAVPHSLQCLLSSAFSFPHFWQNMMAGHNLAVVVSDNAGEGRFHKVTASAVSCPLSQRSSVSRQRTGRAYRSG
jgi:hypothetical protein